VRRRRGACDQRLVRWQPTRAPSWWTDERIRVFGESGFARFFPFPFWEDRHPAPSLSPFPRARLRLHRVAAGPPVSVRGRLDLHLLGRRSAHGFLRDSTARRSVFFYHIASSSFVVVATAGLDWSALEQFRLPSLQQLLLGVHVERSPWSRR